MLLNSRDNTNSKINPSHKIINHLLGIFFGYLYNEMAWTYDWVAAIVSLGRWKSWIESSLSYLDGEKVLELGHGPGHLMVKIMQSGKQGFGIDLSPHMAGIASARIKRLSLPIALSTARAQKLPFDAGEFDHVVATFPTEYILEETTLSEIYRVLKPGGAAVIVAVAYITGTSLLERAAAWLFRITGQSPDFDERVLDPAIRQGFLISSSRISLSNSEVIIIQARKPTSRE
jgi:ubiquinone/menaquinone biosynthesis C-methylase UbiE